MSRRTEIAQLRVLTDLLVDRELAVLRKASEAKAQSEAALMALAEVVPGAYGLEGAAGDLAGLAYQRWADARRAELNQQLAGQTFVWLEARHAARTAFGKAEALRKVAERLEDKS